MNKNISLTELQAIACAAIVIADAGPGKTTGPMWTRLWSLLNDRVRRGLDEAMVANYGPGRAWPSAKARPPEEPSDGYFYSQAHRLLESIDFDQTDHRRFLRCQEIVARALRAERSASQSATPEANETSE